MKKVLICTKYKALADCVSEWLKNHGCKPYRLVGDVDRVKSKLMEKIEKFNPVFLITGYTNSADAHVEIINEARAVKKDISAYVFHGHPESFEAGDLERYNVFSDLYAIFRDMGVTKAA